MPTSKPWSDTVDPVSCSCWWCALAPPPGTAVARAGWAVRADDGRRGDPQGVGLPGGLGCNAGRAARDPAARPAAPIPKPRLSGSTTGYVENAFVGSQIRVRFDAGFGIETPDRAEFFYAKCGCYRLAGIDPQAPGPVGVLPTGANPATSKLIENNLGYQEFQMYAEFAPHQRFSLFADVPVRSLSPSIIPDAAGLGDIRAGVKLGLVASDTRALTFQFRSYFPTGDSEKGLGTAHPSAEFTLLYHDVVAQRVSVGAEFGTWHPIRRVVSRPSGRRRAFLG